MSSILLESFEAEEAAAFVLKHLKMTHETDQHDAVVSLCKELGGLPLAIAHIAGYMEASSISPQETLGMFKDLSDSNAIFNDKPVTTFDYDKALNCVWDIALRELDTDTRKLMQVLSMLSPTGVSDEMLRVGAPPEPGLEFLAKKNAQ